MARWAFNVTLSQRLDNVQRHMTAIILATPRRAGEEDRDFFRRRSREASRAARSMGLWSVRWAVGICDWGGHVERNTASACFAARLNHVRNSDELADRRTHNSNRPATRRVAGYVSRRWWDGYPLAQQHKTLHASSIPS